MPARGSSHSATAVSVPLPARKRVKLALGDADDLTAEGSSHNKHQSPAWRSVNSPHDRRRTTLRAPVTFARRSSLPRPASPRPRQRATASPGASNLHQSSSLAAGRHAKRGGSAPTFPFTQHSSDRRTGKALAPLPTNHSAPRRPITMPSKRNRDPDASLTAPRMTRRMSGALLVPDEPREGSVRGRKRKREVRPVSDTEMEEDGHGAEDVEMEEQRPSVGRRLRSADAGDGAEEDNARQGDDEDEWSESEDDAAATDAEEGDQDDYCLYSASAGELRRLLRDELARLYIQATSQTSSSATALNKEQLIQGIVNARPDQRAQGDASTDDDDSDGSDSPRPFTSHEASPVAELNSRDSKTTKRRGGKKTSRREQHVPTPPHSSGSASTSQGDDDVEQPCNGRTLRNRSQSLPNAGSRPTSDQAKQVARGQADQPRRLIRTRRESLNEEELSQELHARELRNGKKVVRSPKGKGRAVKFGRSVNEEDQDGSGDELFDVEEEDEDQKTSPVAHRTRHGANPSSPLPSPETRPGRAAKSKAVAKLVQSRKGKERAVDQNSSDEDESADEEPADDGDEDMEDLDSPARNRAAKTSGAPKKGRGGRSKTSQVETPPSDADEESGAEPDDEHSEDGAGSGGEEVSAEVTSHLRAPRQLRNGKVVALRRRPSGGEEIVESDDEAEEDMEMGDGEQQDDGPDLKNATSKSLLRCRRDDLVRLCEEREIDGEGTKADLVQALLQWRESHDDSDGTASDTSTATARAETKTQALDAIKTARPRKSRDPPLLMRGHFSSSPEKPHSPVRSKAGEQEEVNALDLESLQLQDKEIAPEKLTKLEKVGSGGFKDVYKGIYRKKTIAIADIRGHLTDMDIKELGLLRDLRHPNIVHFIGVSIPKEPSSVPVMIVTELCANGDLFDYLRGVDHPPFLNMLEIMLGISRGLEYLHTHKPIIIHRDIKSSNVLITADGVAKLNDFGLARIKNSTRSMIRSLVGTVNWQAPELWVAHPKYNEKVDVYSVGLVFWEVLQWHQPVKRYPFEGLNEHAIYDQVGHKKIRPSTASMRRAWGGEVVDLVSAMWDADPASRPPMSQVTLEIEVLMTAEKERVREEKRRG